VAMVGDMTLGVNIDGQGIMAFVDLQADAKDHDPTNANEGEEVGAIDVEHVEALVEGEALVPIQMMLSLSDYDSLQGVSWPFACKVVHCFLGFVTRGYYSYDLAI